MTVCPTGAIVGPKLLDARRCISYLTIEHRTSIPEELRPLVGNRIFGCDDCQLYCPFNRDAQTTAEEAFRPRVIDVLPVGAGRNLGRARPAGPSGELPGESGASPEDCATPGTASAAKGRLDRTTLLDLFAWDEAAFLSNTEGSALRRIDYERWQRNLAVALGNAPPSPAAVDALRKRLPDASPMVREHIEWALARLTAASPA